jgi:hypothetical protein
MKVLHSRVMHRCWNLNINLNLNLQQGWICHTKKWNSSHRFFPKNHPPWQLRVLGGSLAQQQQQQQQQQRSFRLAAAKKEEKEDEQDNNNKKINNNNDILLYERNPQAIMAPRFGLAVAYCHTLYWVWYTVDFVPTVNASPIIDFHVNPMLGKVCCVVALAINIAGAVFVPQQVSKITYHNSQKASARDDTPISVYYHTLPFMMASTQPTKYGLGEVSLNTTSDQVNHLVDILQKKQDDEQQQQQQQHFPPVHIHLKSVNLLFGVFPLPIGLYMTRLEDIKDPVLFLNVLLFATSGASQTTKTKRPISSKKQTTETQKQNTSWTRKQPTNRKFKRKTS